MEIGTLNLKLSGDPCNVVVKHDVTPAELGMYCAMHGEDCVESLVVTSIDKERTINQEKARLEFLFQSEVAVKCMNALYPGLAPQYPTTFRAIGHDPVAMAAGISPGDMIPRADTSNENGIRKRIAEASSDRDDTQKPTSAVPVHAHELGEQATNQVPADPGKTTFSNDPLSVEMATPPPPPPPQE